MANSLICTDSVIAETSYDSGVMRFEKALSLVDDYGVAIPAVFSIDTDEESIPMVGITMYGRVTGQYDSEVDSSKEVTITATPLDTDVDPVEADTTLADLFALEVFGEVGGIS